MKPKLQHGLFVFVMLAIVVAQLTTAGAQSTAFNYQGRLNDANGPANGKYDFTFTLFGVSSGGITVSEAVTNSATTVSNGLFTVTLDFGTGVFTGPDRWLQLDVRTNGNGQFTTLSPRQPVLSVPYSVMANSTSNLLGTLPATQLTGTLPASVLAGYSGSVTLTNGGNSFNGSFSGSFGGSGAGLTNVPGSVAWQVVSGTNFSTAANTGYLLNNNSLVTVTLPASPNIADIVRISDPGAGGWKLATENNQSIINSFPISFNWTAGTSDSQHWQGIASSADGSKLVAVTQLNGIYTSGNYGLTWVNQTNAPNKNWTSVATSANGAKVVAVVNNGINIGGEIYTSGDSGVTWVKQTNAPNVSWYLVNSSADGATLFASGGAGIYRSGDSGVTWMQNNNQNISLLASSVDGTKLLGFANNTGFYTSSDSGVTWVNQPNAPITNSWTAAALSADGTKIVAVSSSGGIYTSSDSGVTWVYQSNAPLKSWTSVASSADGTKLVLVSYKSDLSDNSGAVYTSGDSGTTWTQNNISGLFVAVASSANGKKLVTAEKNGRIFITSTTGRLSGSQNTAIELQYIGNGQWTVLSHEGSISAY